jgi:hypothetical protein
VFLCSGIGLAASYTYDDIYANWPGQITSISNDEYGTPKVFDVTVNTYESDGFEYLQTVIINLTDRRVFDSLFINTGGVGSEWDDWDYFVRDDNLNNELGHSFYSVIDPTNYTYTYNETGIGRVGHANGIDINDLVIADGLLSVVGSSTSLTYLFNVDPASNRIALSDNFIVGYTPWCANDVFLTPVPEPASMLLLGASLFGLALIGRKTFIKRS